jgi:uncharacterized protein (DUF1330 family)
MPKGYWIVHVDVTDAEAYKDYIAANGAAFAKYGARFLVRAATHQVVEGASRARQVVIEFPTYETALACYRSPEYQAALRLRERASEADLVIAEGYDGPQPNAAPTS